MDVEAQALVAFLYHLKRTILPAAECDALEAMTMDGPSLAELHAIDPHTLASARALAARLLAAEAVEDDGEGDTDTLGHDRPSVGEREDEGSGA